MKRRVGSAVPRYQLFSLSDGTYVVQWDEKQVQELFSGEYREFDERRDYGRVINDHEMAQLMTNGIVEDYNQRFAWLMPLPGPQRFRRILGEKNRLRAYYLVTEFPQEQTDSVRDVLDATGLTGTYTVKSRDGRVVILGMNGVPFREVELAEDALQTIQRTAPDVFEILMIAFIEANTRSSIYRASMENETENLDLSDIIASQSDTSGLAGKAVVLAVRHEDEREAFTTLLHGMSVSVKHATSAALALELLEDHQPHLLVMDIQQPDMHGWNLINKIREIAALRELPIIVITDQPNMGVTIARVDYLVRPVSIARLRHSVWVSLNHTVEKDD
jgi:CheY-like chemotaxis protein